MHTPYVTQPSKRVAQKRANPLLSPGAKKKLQAHPSCGQQTLGLDYPSRQQLETKMTLCGSKSTPRPNIVSRLLSRFGFQEFSGGDLGARLPRRISEIVTEDRGRGFHYFIENIIMFKATSEINALATRHIKDVCLFSAHIPLWYIKALKPVHTNTVKSSGI